MIYINGTLKDILGLTQLEKPLPEGFMYKVVKDEYFLVETEKGLEVYNAETSL